MQGKGNGPWDRVMRQARAVKTHALPELPQCAVVCSQAASQAPASRV